MTRKRIALRSLRTLLCVMLIASVSTSRAGEEERGVFAFVIENDLFANTDRHYTSGVQLGISPATRLTPRWLVSLAEASPLFPSRSSYRTAFLLGQNMFTPRDITRSPPPVDDRPYAGWTYLSAALAGNNAFRLNSLELSLGVVGPSSLAKQAQKAIHGVIGADEPRGWNTQQRDEWTLQVTYQRRWRIKQARLRRVDTTFVPHLGLSAGTITTYANIGTSVRLGRGLGNDFGPPRVNPGVPGTGQLDVARNSWYVFSSLDVRQIAYNRLFDGRDGTGYGVDAYNTVGDVQFGVVLNRGSIKYGYTHVFRSLEFDGQQSWASFGSFSIAFGL